jgi:hypothetical protein
MLFAVEYQTAKEFIMENCIHHLLISMALVSLAFAQSQPQQNAAASEKEVREMIEKYRTALLQRDIAALEKIWADDYVFVNAYGDVLTKSAAPRER